MREIRTYGSEGGGAARSPYPYQSTCHDNPQGLRPLPPLLRVRQESLADVVS